MATTVWMEQRLWVGLMCAILEIAFERASNVCKNNAFG